ncbi:MAG: hypothetical protein NWE95_05665 [Candidatus Bathyarchaeota archaeon]|nr:hypothetical protein [Candidatus Bathyarchaeota archaeon]
MNWKHVIYLMQVERKSGRLIRGAKTTRYKENKFLAYWPYWLALVVGILGGLLFNFIATLIYQNPSEIPGIAPLPETAFMVFVSLPTLVLIFSLVLTLLQQIQLSGIKASTQVMYWLPVTWQEHTFASILANLFGYPLGIVIAFSSGTLVFSALNGLILPAILTVLAVFAAAFMASATTEILRILQVRFIGAVYKSSGRAAVWVRFIGSLMFFLIFYVIYFYITSGFGEFFQSLSAIQTSVWFIPYAWLAIMLSYLLNGVVLQGLLFAGLSAVLIAGLYYLAVALNQRFGLYEPPAIRVQKSGIYAPKAGFLGKLGFSTVESAIIHKDLKAFTRRRELISIFIVPIIFMVVPIMQSIGLTNNGAPAEVDFIFQAMIFLFPPSIMAMIVGNILVGEEGQAVWRIYASPVSAKNLVKSKLFFLMFFSLIILVIGIIVGAIIFQPSLKLLTVAGVEAVFLIPAVGTISLAIGFKGADFTETRRKRMIRQEWSLISLIVCTLAGGGVLAPLAPYIISMFVPSFLGVSASILNLAISIIISGIISIVITTIFYRINLNSAADLLRKAEM